MRIIDKLSQDVHFRYEFPVACLPSVTQRALEEGIIISLYAEKLQLHQGNKPPFKLFLNAFEYYFFQFAFSLVNPHKPKTTVWSNPVDTLYPVLVEDYLNYLLPLDQSRLQTLTGRSTESRIATNSPAANSIWSPLQSPYQSPLRHNVSLSHNVSCGHNMPSTPGSPRVPAAAPPVSQSGEPDVWRAQTFLQIVEEFWLNYVSSSDVKSSFSSPLQTGALNSLFTPDRYSGWLQESTLPSVDHVRIIRMLVKHLHYFTNSGFHDNTASSYSNLSPVVPWAVFKKQAVQQYLQKSLYLFLKECFHKWPLDASFRQVLETWLSYIQPWRYTDPALSHRERADDTKDRVVEERWRPFIIENLLFFSALLQSFLFRALRMDHTSPRNAYMMFRVTKVFSALRLRDMISDAENALYDNAGQTSRPGIHSDLSTSLSPSHHHHGSHHHGNMGAEVAMQIAELESASFRYQPLFGEDTVVMVEQLLMIISQAKEAATDIVHKSASDANSSWLSLFGLGRPDYNTSKYYSEGYDDLSYGDLRKIHTHLDQSAANFCQFFQLSSHDRVDKTVSWGATQTDTSPERRDAPRSDLLTPDVYETDDGPKLSPLGRYQVMNGLRKFDIKYQGDPELQPVRSYESAALVRVLYAFTCFINRQCALQFDHYYFRDDFLGQLTRQLLWGPDWAIEGISSSPRPSSSEQSPINQPRLSLRWLANIKLLVYILFIYILLSFWCGLGIVGYVFCVVMVTFVVAVVRVYTHPVKLKTL